MSMCVCRVDVRCVQYADIIDKTENVTTTATTTTTDDDDDDFLLSENEVMLLLQQLLSQHNDSSSSSISSSSSAFICQQDTSNKEHGGLPEGASKANKDDHFFSLKVTSLLTSWLTFLSVSIYLQSMQNDSVDYCR